MSCFYTQRMRINFMINSIHIYIYNPFLRPFKNFGNICMQWQN